MLHACRSNDSAARQQLLTLLRCDLTQAYQLLVTPLEGGINRTMTGRGVLLRAAAASRVLGLPCGYQYAGPPRSCPGEP